MDAAVARELNDLLLDVSRRLDASIEVVRNTCSHDEFEAYRQSVGRIMGEILVEILMRIYREHPEITPATLKQD